MIFRRIDPSPQNKAWIECYWIIENDDPKPISQKIIPDGFPEIIFHFADPYRINLGAGWEMQSASLLAGQISRHFYLENTGKASMLGIKLKPATLTYLFGMDMEWITDKVIGLPDSLLDLESVIRYANDFDNRVQGINRYFEKFNEAAINNAIDQALIKIFESRGMAKINDVAADAGFSERQLERQFKKHIGLSPKFYSRVIRFSSIFQLHEQGDPSWLDLAYEAGYADQSHFIRNFKAFTGDDPTSYGFDEKNMANFFLKKR
jgi:AraC-like DNA-binding protein